MHVCVYSHAPATNCELSPSVPPSLLPVPLVAPLSPLSHAHAGTSTRVDPSPEFESIQLSLDSGAQTCERRAPEPLLRRGSSCADSLAQPSKGGERHSTRWMLVTSRQMSCEHVRNQDGLTSDSFAWRCTWQRRSVKSARSGVGWPQESSHRCCTNAPPLIKIYVGCVVFILSRLCV